jgi:DnaJ-class molecular chaperone
MNYDKACKILEINDIINVDDIDDIKKQYKSLALQYHPDKNASADATEKFQQIHEAYQFLLKNNKNYEEDDDDELDREQCKSYQGMLFSFLKKIIINENSNQIFFSILQKISLMCEERAIETIRKLDKNTLLKTYELIKKYVKVLHFSEKFMEELSKIVSEKTMYDECIILNPTLDDLFENNLYRLNVNGHLYIVPLWHHELVYDNSGNDIYVRCDHILPEGIVFGPNNNLFVKLVIDIKQIWVDRIHIFYIGTREFQISADKLKLVPQQLIMLSNKGISRINTKDIYDINNKGDIIIDIKLML